MNETTRGFFADGAFSVPPFPEQERMVEAVLFASKGPLSAREIAERLRRGATFPRRWRRSGGATRGAGSSSRAWARPGRSARRRTSGS